MLSNKNHESLKYRHNLQYSDLKLFKMNANTDFILKSILNEKIAS